MGRIGRTGVAAFDAVVMGSFAWIETGGALALTPAHVVLWGSAAAAALCAAVVYAGGSAVLAWGAIGFVLFGALLTAGAPHLLLAALAVALMPLVPRPRGSLWLGLGTSAVVAVAVAYATSILA